MPLDLDQYRMGQLPTLFLVHDYLSEDEQQRLLGEITSCRAKWTAVSGRRLQNHGGSVLGTGLVQASMPSWLQGLVTRLSQGTGIYGGALANHVLINSYAPGEGIMPHEDGPLYHPAVCILSLAAPAVIRFWRRRPPGEEDGGGQAPPLASVVLPPRSLLVFQDEAYTGCLHGIEAVETEAIDGSVANAQQCGLVPGDALPRGGERVSLTVRRVLKVHKGLAIRL